MYHLSQSATMATLAVSRSHQSLRLRYYSDLTWHRLCNDLAQSVFLRLRYYSDKLESAQIWLRQPEQKVDHYKAFAPDWDLRFVNLKLNGGNFLICTWVVIFSLFDPFFKTHIFSVNAFGSIFSPSSRANEYVLWYYKMVLDSIWFNPDSRIQAIGKERAKW